MKGSIVAAAEGDEEAARRAQVIAGLLIEQHRYPARPPGNPELMSNERLAQVVKDAASDGLVALTACCLPEIPRQPSEARASSTLRRGPSPFWPPAADQPVWPL
jgi:hypothetical protein